MIQRIVRYSCCNHVIAVGMHVDCLKAMVVTGQPKQNSEYIQATSRIGRAFPGLVLRFITHIVHAICHIMRILRVIIRSYIGLLKVQQQLRSLAVSKRPCNARSYNFCDSVKISRNGI